MRRLPLGPITRWSALVSILAITACTSGNAPPPAAQKGSLVGLPNPATVHCLRAGGQASTVRAPDGAEQGLCTLPSGQICDQWALFRGECGARPR